MYTCNYCGQQFSEPHRFCPVCGKFMGGDSAAEAPVPGPPRANGANGADGTAHVESVAGFAPVDPSLAVGATGTPYAGEYAPVASGSGHIPVDPSAPTAPATPAEPPAAAPAKPKRSGASIAWMIVLVPLALVGIFIAAVIVITTYAGIVSGLLAMGAPVIVGIGAATLFWGLIFGGILYFVFQARANEFRRTSKARRKLDSLGSTPKKTPPTS
jgi:hypothetical protein